MKRLSSASKNSLPTPKLAAMVPTITDLYASRNWP
jgi:hypothetical protein